MKILNVGSHDRVKGGSDRYFLALQTLLESKGHRVIPFAARASGSESAQEPDHFPPGVDPSDPGPGDVARFVFNPAARAAMSRVVEREDPDLAHLHVYAGQLSASILKPLREHGVPVVQTLHDFKLGCPVRTFVSRDTRCEACEGSHFWRALPRRCNRGSLSRTALNVLEAYVSRWMGDVEEIDHFIAVSEFLRGKMLEHGVVSADDITTIHNFLDASTRPPPEGPGQHVLYAGRLTPLKGVDVLLEAVSECCVDVVIAGEGRSRARLEAEVETKGLEHVRFLGHRDDRELERLVSDSICTVVPSVGYESFGLSALESLAGGRPVVASRIGGLPEVVDDGVDGCLVPPGDVGALEEAIRWMVRHREEAAEMGAVGRRKVRTSFDPDSHYERVMRTYRRVAGVPGR